MYAIFLSLLISFSVFTYADDIGYESPYIYDSPALNDLAYAKYLAPKSNTQDLIALQTSVKSQKSRGTCTMFTAMGLLEHTLIRDHSYPRDIDFSEEWMEYIIMSSKTTEGSSISKNLKAVHKYGVVYESTLPYIGKRWRELADSPLAMSRCGDFSGTRLQSCLLGHRDPYLLRMSDEQVLSLGDADFVTIRNEATALKEEIVSKILPLKKSYKIKKLSKVKELLLQNQSVIMGVKLFYGSWNHSKTDKLNIQARDKKKWYEGIVTYPEVGSFDRRISMEKGGGHSLILVGYDDEKIIHSKMKMEDGTWREFTYKGVYYFKNSWGVRGSGRDFTLDGESFPGYGMISQKYAHEFGSFYAIPNK